MLEFCRIDKKSEREISKPIILEVKDSECIFDYGSSEVIRNNGITPTSWICLTLESYAKSSSQHAMRYPIYPDYFEILEVPDALREEIENKFKGAEEIIRLIKLTGVSEELKEGYEDLEKAYSKFKANFFEDAKTSLRKVLETIKGVIRPWENIDGSKHLAEGIISLTNSLFSLSSSGGPHKGVATLDETEVILNSTLSLFRYVNKLVKERRFEVKEEKDIS